MTQKLMTSIWLIALLSLGSAMAAPMSVNDFTPDGDDIYQTAGPDPHLIFDYKNDKSIVNTGSWVSINLFERQNTDANNPKLQLYWRQGAETFSQTRMISANIKLGENRFFLPFPLIAASPDQVRIDVEGCVCKIAIGEPIASDEIVAAKHYPSGFAQYLKLYQGFDLAIDDWVGQELEQERSGIFTFSGWDPRIINQTPLNISSGVAAGIYFAFDYDTQTPYQKFELFWQLAGLKWSALRSAHFLLENTGSNQKQIFIPFERIYSSRRLNRLRLDFAACETCRFALKQARIVGIGEQHKYQEFIPDRLYYVHTEHPPAAVMKRDIARKLSYDWPFFIVWLLLIAATIGLGVRFIRRHV